MTVAGEMKDGHYDPVERAAGIPYHVAYRPEAVSPEQV
jgi:hypothetical protein